jgi:mannose-6-phosphate isomerase-like protein (cupin superfamily)
MERPKTIFCDIDGTLIKHQGDVIENLNSAPELLPHAIESIKEWEKLNYKIVLITGRKESSRERTEAQLASLGIIYDKLIMGITNGERILINDKKPVGIDNTARAVNIVRNAGLAHIDITKNELSTATRIEKPWGCEELVEHNSSYVVKKLFMKKGHSCSLQYHELKTETIVVLNGKLTIYIGTTPENLEKIQLEEGQHITIKPYTIHKMEGLEDCVYLESSTNELWDVVRLQDNYGRV